MSRVILRPLLTSTASWAGVIKYRNCYEDIGPYLTRSGSQYTGLTPEDAVRLGELLGLDLTRGSDYWKSFYIRTSGKDMFFDPENETMDELKVLYLKSHKKVKTSIFEHKATANFVLVDQEEESKKTNLFNRVKRDAMLASSKMTPEEMRKALRIFGKSAENLSPEIVENRLFEIVEGDPESFLLKWVNNKKRDTQYLVERAISLNIIRKNKRIYSYGTDTIGHGLEDTMSYLDDPKNQDVRIAIMQGVEGKQVIDKPVAPKVDVLSLKDQPKQQLSMRPVKEVQEEIKKSSKK
jgi:hypothetical protein